MNEYDYELNLQVGDRSSPLAIGTDRNYGLLLEYIKKFCIVCVVDVRLSRKAWNRMWYGQEIEKLCSSEGISYISKTSLGNISGDNHWIPPDEKSANEALIEIAEIAKSGNILLLCAELDSNRCHRVDVAQKLKELVNVPITNLK